MYYLQTFDPDPSDFFFFVEKYKSIMIVQLTKKNVDEHLQSSYDMGIGDPAIRIVSGIYDNDKKLLPEPNNLKVPYYLVP